MNVEFHNEFFVVNKLDINGSPKNARETHEIDFKMKVCEEAINQENNENQKNEKIFKKKGKKEIKIENNEEKKENSESKNKSLNKMDKIRRLKTETSKKSIKEPHDNLIKLEKISSETLKTKGIRPMTNEANKSTKTQFSNRKELPKIPILNKGLKKIKTNTFSPNNKIDNQTSNFQEIAKKFNSIAIFNEEPKNETNILESINATNSDDTSEKFDDGSIQTVKSIIYSNNDGLEQKNEVEETFDNEFIEKKIDKKETFLDKIKMFKNSSLITCKNNERVVLERKDNFENKGFINDIHQVIEFQEQHRNFIFDPVLKSFYDPKTQTYYHKI